MYVCANATHRGHGVSVIVSGGVVWFLVDTDACVRHAERTQMSRSSSRARAPKPRPARGRRPTQSRPMTNCPRGMYLSLLGALIEWRWLNVFVYASETADHGNSFTRWRWLCRARASSPRRATNTHMQSCVSTLSIGLI